MRVGLITDGMYPYRSGIGGTWAHRLIRGLPEHAFHLTTITDRAPAGSAFYRPAAFYPPANAPTLTSICLDGAAMGPTKRRASLRHRRLGTHAAVLMCRSMLEDTPSSVAIFRTALRYLASGGDDQTHSLHSVPLSAVLLDAWRAASTRTGGSAAMRPRAALPSPTADDARLAANLIKRAFRPLSAPLPLTELNHAADAGLAALVAIGAKWRTGTPYVLTEHHTYLDAPLMSHTYGRPGVRAVLLCFFRALCRLAHYEAGMTAAPSDALRRWAADHGADRDRLVLAPYGVDPHSCALIRGEPADPNVTWLGPERDLSTMVAALPAIRAAQPSIRVLVAGPASEIEDRCESAYVGFLGPVTHRRSAYANGQIVVLSAADESMPYALIEAMMCGRPTVVIGDAEIANVVGMGAVVTPPHDPRALADAVITLLGDPARRRALSVAAGQRARNLFALRSQLDCFRDVYERASRDTSAANEPIPSAPIPATPVPPMPAAPPKPRAAAPPVADAPASATPEPNVVDVAPAPRPAGRPGSLGALAAKLLAPLPPEAPVVPRSPQSPGTGPSHDTQGLVDTPRSPNTARPASTASPPAQAARNAATDVAPARAAQVSALCAPSPASP
jgi:polysaccharide biosynthesis protein PelF